MQEQLAGPGSQRGAVHAHDESLGRERGVRHHPLPVNGHLFAEARIHSSREAKLTPVK